MRIRKLTAFSLQTKQPEQLLNYQPLAYSLDFLATLNPSGRI